MMAHGLETIRPGLIDCGQCSLYKINGSIVPSSAAQFYSSRTILKTLVHLFKAKAQAKAKAKQWNSPCSRPFCNSGHLSNTWYGTEKNQQLCNIYVFLLENWNKFLCSEFWQLPVFQIYHASPLLDLLSPLMARSGQLGKLALLLLTIGQGWVGDQLL